LFPDQVYVFTPKGEIFSLPKASTVVDFAYQIHTDVGNHCVAARINSELVPLRTPLNNGDRVEVVTDEKSHPNPAWLNFVTTGKARSHIRHYFKDRHLEESAELGERMLSQALRALKVEPTEITTQHWDKLLKGDNAKTKLDVLSDIGLGKELNVVVARRLLSLNDTLSQQPGGKPLGSLIIRGTEGMAVQLAQCCRPIPGDPIIGFIKKGQGLVIHTHDCPAIRQFDADPDKWLDVEWDPVTQKYFDVTINIVTQNQRGVLGKVAAAIGESGANIENVSAEERESADYGTWNIMLQVTDRAHLATVMKNVRQIPQVVRINRKIGLEK
jgi:GTP pyrophosphokinase